MVSLESDTYVQYRPNASYTREHFTLKSTRPRTASRVVSTHQNFSRSE